MEAWGVRSSSPLRASRCNAGRSQHEQITKFAQCCMQWDDWSFIVLSCFIMFYHVNVFMIVIVSMDWVMSIDVSNRLVANSRDSASANVGTTGGSTHCEGARKPKSGWRKESNQLRKASLWIFAMRHPCSEVFAGVYVNFLCECGIMRKEFFFYTICICRNCQVAKQ